jgi:hypothetical protein
MRVEENAPLMRQPTYAAYTATVARCRRPVNKNARAETHKRVTATLASRKSLSSVSVTDHRGCHRTGGKSTPRNRTSAEGDSSQRRKTTENSNSSQSCLQRITSTPTLACKARQIPRIPDNGATSGQQALSSQFPTDSANQAAQLLWQAPPTRSSTGERSSTAQ